MRASYCADGRDRLIVFESRNRRGLLPLHADSNFQRKQRMPEPFLKSSDNENETDRNKDQCRVSAYFTRV
jgi:hypothetical protein